MSHPVPQSQPDREILERIELAFPDLLGSFEVRARDLELDGQPVAHWLACAGGCALLVSVVNGREDSAPLRALEGLAFVRSEPEWIARQCPELDDSPGAVRVLLVALEGFSERQLRRLGAFVGDELTLCCRHEVRTQRGTHTRLEVIECEARPGALEAIEVPEWIGEGSFQGFLVRAGRDRLPLAIRTLERLRRLDPQLEWRDHDSGLAACLKGQELFHLCWTEEGLELILDRDQACLSIRDEAELERAVEKLLGVYLEALALAEAGRTRPRPARLTRSIPSPERAEPSSPQPLPELDGQAEEQDDLEPLEDLETIEVQPMPPGPLLTREEIEAFQE